VTSINDNEHFAVFGYRIKMIVDYLAILAEYQKKMPSNIDSISL